MQIEPLAAKLSEMSACDSFKELINKYGNEKDLLSDYRKGLEFAPDKKRYIEKRIHFFEETLVTFVVTNHVWDFVNKISIPIQCGTYKRLGFEWVNNGINASEEDFDLVIYRNTDLWGLHITNEEKNLIYLSKFRLLADGGALAFHIAFLRNELNKKDLGQERIVNTMQTNYTTEQLKKLYELLIKDKYIIETNENDFIYFFSGKPLINMPKIYWNASKKKAFYLLTKICINFSLPTVNKCIKTNYKPLDHNDNSPGYQEIDDILKLCDL
jgi:hypothetical protein